jgi:hypothetical protein
LGESSPRCHAKTVRSSAALSFRRFDFLRTSADRRFFKFLDGLNVWRWNGLPWDWRRYRTDNQWDGQGEYCSNGEKQLSGTAQLNADAIAHDRLQSSFDVGAADAGHTRERRFDIALADNENPFGIRFGFLKHLQNLFVAGALTLVD